MDINLTSQILIYNDLASFPATGAAKTFYVADDTEKLYRWNGSAYVEVSAGSASTTWGGITGTLSNQTDLQNALNAKQDSGTYLTSSNITQTITNGVTDKAPSEDVVHDALALKADLTVLPFDVSSYRKTGATPFKNYYTQAINSVATGTASKAQNNANYFHFIVGKTTTLAEIGLSITTPGTAGSVVRIAIYSASTTTQLPDQLILNAGTILGDSGTAQLITGLSTVLTPGLYFLYMNHNSTANITFRGLTPTATYMLCGYTSALGTTAGNYYEANQTYTATPPATALAPTTNVSSSSSIAFYMYFSS